MHIAPRHKVLFGLAIVSLVANFIVPRLIRNTIPQTLGVTFSHKFAWALGYDWKEAYTAILDDLGAKRIRVPVYWDDIEPEQGRFDFKRVDFEVDEAEKRGAKVVLAIGRKLPRWPECHVPEWAKASDREASRQQVLDMLDEVVSRYKDRDAVLAWQVENEPFLRYGDCPRLDLPLLIKEVRFVRQHDPRVAAGERPIIMTESGELSPWIFVGFLADNVGVTLYRTVWDQFLGYITWPLPPEFYIWHKEAVRSVAPRMLNSELQGEPWFERPIEYTSLGDQMKLFSPNDLRSNLAFTRLAGFTDVDFWGVEWWYWMKLQGYPQYWDTAKELFATSSFQQ